MSSTYIDNHYARTAIPAMARPPLSGVVETEVCVIGGGLAGLSTALGLAERGVSVALVEDNRVGWGASGRNGGFVSAGFSISGEAIVRRVGLAHARELRALSRDAVAKMRARIVRHEIKCEPVDGILCASWFDDRAESERERNYMAETFGEEIEFWPREKLRESLVSERYFDGLFNPHGFHFHPLNYCLGIAAAIESLGARVFEASPAVRLDLEGAVKHVWTPEGEVRADRVVLTCGGYMGRLQRRLAGAIIPVATYVITTEPLGERLETAIRVPYAVHDNRFALDYYRPLADSRILWGGRISTRRDPPDLAKLMLGDLLKVYPQLKGIRVDTAWSGLMSYARHKMPQVGELEPGVWYAMGFGGHGMNTTTMAGEMVAGAIAAGDDRYRLLAPFGLPPTFGPLGKAAAQLIYWFHQSRDSRRS